MEDDARRNLIARAMLQNAREEIRRARANMPIGIGLMLIGVGISIAIALLPVGLVAKVMIAGIGFAFIPGGLAVVIRSSATIARANRQMRELEPPAARLISKP
jgi:hypothetical protein